MKIKLFFISVFSLLMIGCNKQPQNDYETLQAERDSLMRETELMQSEMENYFATINLIEKNIEKIKNAERLITIQPYGEEEELDTRNKINDDLNYLNQMLRANREEIRSLKEKLKQSNFKFTELERTIDRLTKALDAEAAKVYSLELQLVEKDSVIAELNINIEDLSADIDSLEAEKEEHITTIKEQEEVIHTAWYVFGTKNELREQSIITSDGWFRPNRVLESDFNKSYFVRIDARKTNSIPLYSSKAKILSTHPKSSYALEKENGSFTLLITDTQDFWSISRYLVIEVD